MPAAPRGSQQAVGTPSTKRARATSLAESRKDFLAEELNRTFGLLVGRAARLGQKDELVDAELLPSLDSP